MESALFIRELWTLIFTLTGSKMLYLVSLVCKDFYLTITSNSRLKCASYKNDIIGYALAENNNNLLSWAVKNRFRVTYNRLSKTFSIQNTSQFKLATKYASNENKLIMLEGLYSIRDVYNIARHDGDDIIRKIRILESSTKIKLFVVARTATSMIFYVVVAYYLQILISKTMYDNTINFIEHIAITFEKFFLLTHEPLDFMSYRQAITSINILICLSVELWLNTVRYYNVIFILPVIDKSITFNYAPIGPVFWSSVAFFILVVHVFI